MAIKYWDGTDSGNDGDFATAANWVPSGVPASDDILVFDGRTNQDLTDNVDQSAKHFDQIWIHSGHSGKIGTAANPLCCGVDEFVVLEGSGDIYLMCGEGASNSEIPVTVVKVPASTYVQLMSEKNDTYQSSFKLVVHISGELYICGDNPPTAPTPTMDAGTFVNQIITVPQSTQNTAAKLHIGDGCTDDVGGATKTELIASAGQIKSETEDSNFQPMLLMGQCSYKKLY